MKVIIGFLKKKSAVQLVGITALCALIWYAGPWVAIAGKAPLLPEFNRLLAILYLCTDKRICLHRVRQIH